METGGAIAATQCQKETQVYFLIQENNILKQTKAAFPFNFRLSNAASLRMLSSALGKVPKVELKYRVDERGYRDGLTAETS